MKNANKDFTILMADDDSDEYCLMKHAFAEKKVPGQLKFVSDGAELLDYLLHRGRFADVSEAPKPHLIILDLNMPRIDGKMALMEIRAMAKLREIPVIIFTSSRDSVDINQSYQAGANSYIAKPQTLDEMLDIVEILGSYWMKTVMLPCTEDF